MRFIEDGEGGRGKVAEPVSERAGIGLVTQERVGDDEPLVRRPRIHGIAMLTTSAEEVGLIENNTRETEPVLRFVAPLEDDRGQAGHDEASSLLAHQ